MNLDPTTAVAASIIFALTSAAMYAVYDHARETFPEEQRPRVFMCLMSIPVILVALLLTSNPLPALATLLPAARKPGPSG